MFFNRTEAMAKRFEKKMGINYPCAVCGKPCPNPKAYVHTDLGECEIVSPGEYAGVNDGAKGGLYPVGSGCVQKEKATLQPFLVDQNGTLFFK